MLFYNDEDALYYRVEKRKIGSITGYTKCIMDANGEKTWIPITKFEYVQPTIERFIETNTFKSYTDACDYYKEQIIFEKI